MRWRIALIAGASFLTAATLGAVIGDLWHATAGIIGVAALSVVALVTSYVMVATRAGPPGTRDVRRAAHDLPLSTPIESHARRLQLRRSIIGPNSVRAS